MKLRYLGGRYQGRILEIEGDDFGIGRDADNDLVIDDEGASRRHCRIYREEDGWFIEDLKSTNGVRVNGKRIERACGLKPGDHIGVCHQLLLFSDDAGIVDPAVLHPRSDASNARLNQAVTRPAAEGPSEYGPVSKDGPSVAESRSFPWVRVLAVVLLLAGGVIAVVVTLRTPPPAPDENATVGAAGAGAEVEGPAVSDTGSGPGAAKVLEPPKSPLPPVSLPQAPGKDAVSGNAQPPSGTGEGVAGTNPVRPPAGPATAVPAKAKTAPAAPPLRPPSGGVLGIVDSRPRDAAVELDGEALGKTPLVLRALASGRHRIRLQLDGYEEVTRQIYVPGALPDKPYVLHLRPGVLLVESTPVGAAVLKGTQMLGRTPLLLRNLVPGKYELRLVAWGFAPQVLPVEVSDLRGTAVQVELKSALGGIGVTTQPPGCSVAVDGDPKGVTVPSKNDKRRSNILDIPGFARGEHLVQARHPLGGIQVRKVPVEPGETVGFTLSFWIPDTRLRLVGGGTRIGMLVKREANGDLVLAEAPRNTKRYARAKIAAVEQPSEKAVRQLVAKYNTRAPVRTARTGGEAGRGIRPTLFGDDIVPPRKRGAPPAVTPPARPPADTQIKTYTVDELERMFRARSGIDLKQRFVGRTLSIRGIPTADRASAGRFFVDLGKQVHCYFTQDAFKAILTRVRVAHARRNEITITGRCRAYHMTGLELENCRVEDEGDETGERR